MFQKNVYAFCTLLALSSSAYGMEERGDLSSSVERGSSRKLHGPLPSPRPVRPSLALAAVPGESGEESFEPFPKDTFPSASPLEFDCSATPEGFSPKMTASPASSTQRSLFPDGTQATFTLRALRQAADRSSPDRDLRAEALCNFIEDAFFHYQHLLNWESTDVHTLPILANELDDDSFRKILNESKNKMKLGVSLRVYPTMEEVMGPLREALGEYSRIYDDPDKSEVKLRQMVLRGATKITALEDELAELRDELEASNAEIAAQEEVEKQLTSQLEASKAETAELRASLEKERAKYQNLLAFHNTIQKEALPPKPHQPSYRSDVHGYTYTYPWEQN